MSTTGRGFLKAVFGAAFGAVTRCIGDVVEALVTRRASNQVLSALLGVQICDAKFLYFPNVELVAWTAKAEERFYGEGRLEGGRQI